MAASGKMRFDLDTSAVSAKLDRLDKKVDKIPRGFNKSNAGLGKLVSGFAVATAGATAVLDVWQKINQNIDEAASKIQGSARARAKALSLAQNENDRNRISQSIDRTRKETGLDEGRASEVQFQLESLGLSDRRQQVASVELLGNDSVQFAKGLSRVSKVLNIQGKELGEVADKMFVASKNSEVSLDELAIAIAQAAPIGKEVGATFDELASLFGGVGGDDLAQIRTGFKALSRGLLKEGITDSGIIGGVDQLASRNLTPRQLQKILGDEGFIAFQLIQAQRQGISSVSSSLSSAGGAINRQLGIVRGDDSVKFAQLSSRQQQSIDIAERPIGLAKLERDIIQRNREERLRAEGFGALVSAGLVNPAEFAFRAAGGEFNDNGATFIDAPVYDAAINRRAATRVEVVNRQPATYDPSGQEGGN